MPNRVESTDRTPLYVEFAKSNMVLNFYSIVIYFYSFSGVESNTANHTLVSESTSQYRNGEIYCSVSLAVVSRP